MKLLFSFFNVFVVSLILSAQIELTHNIGNDLIATSMFSCNQDEFWARSFVLEDYGINSNDSFSITSAQFAYRKSYAGADAQFNIYKIDADFPNSFSEEDLIGSSQIVPIPFSSYNSIDILTIVFDTPILISNNVDRILVEVKKTRHNGPGTPTMAVFIAGTDFDNDYSWYKGCLGIYNYKTTEDPIISRPDARFFIKVNGFVNLSDSGIAIQKIIDFYPNPTKNFLNLKLPNNDSITNAYLMDLFGNKVKIKENNNNKIDLFSFKTGFYILIIETKQLNKYSLKIIKTE